jgi:RNA-directed DNA polymerase
MKEPHREGVAIHSGPESCAAARKGSGEALTGEKAGRVLSREIILFQDVDAVIKSGRPHQVDRHREIRLGPARSETPRMRGYISHGSREIPRSPTAEGAAGRIGKSKDARR